MLMQSDLYKSACVTRAEEGAGEKLPGEGVGFQRIRRITGYLVGDLARFNNAKRAEESDRVRHGLGGLHGN